MSTLQNTRIPKGHKGLIDENPTTIFIGIINHVHITLELCTEQQTIIFRAMKAVKIKHIDNFCKYL